MQPIAAWLVARPHNAVFTLAASFLLPFAPVLSGALMAFIALAFGPSRSGLIAIGAMVMLAIVAFATNANIPTLLANVAGIWGPAFVLAALLKQWRSVALTLQVSVIIALVVILAAHVVIEDTTAYGAALIVNVATIMSQAGLQEQADMLNAASAELAPQVLLLVVFVGWQVNVTALLFGYSALQYLPGKSAVYGRFRDLNFGRVLAILMAITSIGGWLSGVMWLQNVAFLLFMGFWLQGLAVLHWLRAEKRLPTAALVAIYVSLPLLHILPLIGLAAGGYADAWVGFRRRASA